jgi:hypothetical protein
MNWNSPIPEQRWRGRRRAHIGTDAFSSLAKFEEAALSELEESLTEQELKALGRLLERGQKVELELFTRTHGANPLFDPQAELDVPIGVAKADVVSLDDVASFDANQAILDGQVLHVLFQAGEASRFGQGPLYKLNPVEVARRWGDEADAEVKYFLESLSEAAQDTDGPARAWILETPLGPKQPVLIRAALRRVIQEEIGSGRLETSDAIARYKEALANQKLLFFVSQHGDVNALHDQSLTERFAFFGFKPENVMTIEQEVARGIKADADGRLLLVDESYAHDAAGHLYALIQAARTGGFTTYTPSGRPIKPMELDAFSYAISRGAKYMNIIRINDMDRHTTEIVNGKALTIALKMFEEGIANVIETVANPDGQKGGTGITFGDPDLHVLTETHENSFPTLARAYEKSVQSYLAENQGRHPAYNAMRQWSQLALTREMLRTHGGRIVFVPRQKQVGDQQVSYIGVDMPMGDLTLLYKKYPSRMFQFVGEGGRELLIHDMKKKENLPIALRTMVCQLEDPHVTAAVQEILDGTYQPFHEQPVKTPAYSAPCPEFQFNKTH